MRRIKKMAELNEPTAGSPIKYQTHSWQVINRVKEEWQAGGIRRFLIERGAATGLVRIEHDPMHDEWIIGQYFETLCITERPEEKGNEV
jgi:hypothetical protein